MPPNKLLSVLRTQAKGLAKGSPHADRLIKIADMMATPKAGKGFDDFQKFFNTPDLGEKVKSAVVERITRTLLKVVRITKSTKDFYRDKKAQDRMLELIMTDEGSRKVLEIAKKSPASRAFIRALSLARTSATGDGSGEGALASDAQSIADRVKTAAQGAIK